MVGCDLPEGVLEEIFSWLPPESLIRFKCVSKSWYVLIDFLIRNSEFVDKHLRNMDTTCLVFCCFPYAYCRRKRDLFKSVTISYDDDDDNGHINCVSEDFYLPTLPSEVGLDPAFAFRRHCNGIICLAHNETIVLCNPAINEWRVLPKPCLASCGFEVLLVAFGYDSRSCDFKVVWFGRHRLLYYRTEYYGIRAEVYSMRNDSWKEIGIQLDFDDCPFIGEGVFCKGIFYWYVGIDKKIISFDTFDEVSHSIPLPNNLLVALKDHFIQLTVWNESIALFIYKRGNRVRSSIEVWVTDDWSGGLNASCSWIRKLIIRPPVKNVCPLAFLKNDEVLMKATTTRFVLYNIRSQKLKNLTLEYPNSSVNWDFSYVKSLFSVEGGSHSRS